MAESSETNNLASLALTVTDPVATLMPDLTFVASSTSLSASSGSAGAAITVSSTISNTGTGPASSQPYAVYLSADQSFDAGDVQLGSATGATLASSQTSPLQLSATIPAATASGSYYILVVLNPDNSLTESSNDNNTTSLAFTVTVATAGQQQTAGLTIGVYPNPARTGYFLVSLSGAKAAADDATLTLFNTLGQRVAQRQVPGRTGVSRFDTQTLSQGVYLLHITGNNLHVVQRIVVE
ncbi:T9SS type A sorting domain-containing protein [Hymenobacter sp. J193]|uniref:T9SS type A sorting domain-containing protein n=1 Tax=Hymenobacter sp. J193 TaxID=2898429 RepID=UPI0021507A29|nr:T9SS type A sorting domain-containing protein [Hymenobacter sp. J193]MCR5888600.1 T9SS type A sorting domain-containing protein [Hymenobacter sp. J193]